MSHSVKKAAATLFLSSIAAGALATSSAQTFAITNAELMMVGDADDPQKIDSGTIVVRNGRIAAIGASISVPAGVETIDAAGKPVTPGIFAALSGLGVVEISLDRESNDRSPREDVGIVAAMNATDGFNPDTTVIPISRAGGVTRAVTALDAGSELVSGCAAIIDLSGAAEPYTRECAANIATLGYAGASRVGDSRPAAMAAFRSMLADVAAYRDDPFGYARAADHRRLSSMDAKALVPVLAGERRLLVMVHSAADIRRVLDLAGDYGLNIAIVGGAEAHRVAAELAATDVPVILNPFDNLPSNGETFGATLKAAGILAEAGVTVAFYDNGIGYTHNLRLLPQLAGNAVANGMTHTDALSAITAGPAQIYGLDDELGTLQSGKIADLVIWDGDPLEVTSRPTAVYIDGKETSLDNRQLALARRYRDLEPGDKPFVYRGE